ncbi:MAG TPA: hypothetical protein VJ746_03635 [Nitrospira sp.]|nr:hypothetical protein [Nitrospira sp.]
MRPFNIFAFVVLIGSASQSPYALAADQADVRSHAEQSFERLTPQGAAKEPAKSTSQHVNGPERSSYPSDQYLVGKGQGDMAKGPIVCQRVSELSARTDLAKQIRILVKEHMVDRVREGAGRDAEQDVEVTREEIVQEYLQGVKIVDRHIDEEKKLCTATAIMPKREIQPKPALGQSEPASGILR